MTTDDAVRSAVQSAWRSYAGTAPVPRLALSVTEDDHSLVVTPPTAGAARIWIDYGSSQATLWASVGQDSRFEVEGDTDRLSSICLAVFEGRFKERLRVSDGKVLESEGFIDGNLATTHQAAWASGLRASLRASAWEEVNYAPFAIAS